MFDKNDIIETSMAIISNNGGFYLRRVLVLTFVHLPVPRGNWKGTF